MDFESDPAADFLNREREELGGIIDDNEGGLLLCQISTKNFSYRFADSLLDALFQTQNEFSTDDFELINSEIQQASESQTDELADDLAGMSFTSTIPVTTHQVPEKIRLWREEMERSLIEKDQKEQEAKEALRVAAAKEMEEWVAKYNDTMEKTKNLNRSNDKTLQSPEPTESDAKNMWESISTLCDFTGKGPKNTKDASRMRSIFLQMKSAPRVQ